MAWTTLTFATLEVLSSTKMTQLQANFTAIMQESASIPTWTKVTMTPGSAIIPLTITQGYNEKGILINSDATGYYAIDIASCQFGLNVVCDLDDGTGLAVYRNINDNGSYPLVWFIAGTNVFQYPVLQIDNGGATYSEVITRTTAGAVSYFHGDGNNADRLGIFIACGTDDNSGTNTHIAFLDGNGDVVGNITSSGGTVSYNAFTGGHYANIENFDENKYKFGKIVILKKVLPNKFIKSECHQPEYEVELSSKKNDKRVFGVYAEKIENQISSVKAIEGKEYIDEKTGIKRKSKKYEDINSNDIIHHIYGLGDGFIWVCNQGGNIANGDYITTSDEEGNGMKQDDDLLHSYTIAKSLEDVDWSKEKETSKKIACTYHAS